MKLATSSAMKKLDSLTIDVLGVPSEVLMENAAGHIAAAAEEKLGAGGRAAVFCGSGNNGGDGVAAAYMLKNKGYEVRVFLTGKREKMTRDTKLMETRLADAGGEIEDYTGEEEQREYVKSCGVIIDAMFGIGLNSPLRGQAAAAAELISKAGGYVIAADIPSGVFADTGEVSPSCVNADMTVTFTLGKPGLYSAPGCLFCGQVRVCRIGIPEEEREKLAAETYLVEKGDIALPKRAVNTHKGTYGRDFIIAGSIGYTGAPVLAADAASRMGAGLVYLGVPDSIYAITAIKCAEVMPFPLKGDECGMISWGAREDILEHLDGCSACLVGPGLGQSYQMNSIVGLVLKNAKVPVVLDADGINALSGNIDILKETAAPVVLTPHPGEFLRIGGDLSAGRISGARDFAKNYGCTVILKGYRTVTALPDGRVYINATGGPGMAKGGSGDVLAGMVTSLLGQGFDIKDACISAVYLHGLAGDMCAEELGEYSVIAGDIISKIPEAVKNVMR